MFFRLFSVLGKIPSLKHPKLYILTQLWICLCIILQRIILIMQSEQDQPLKPLLQILIILIFLTTEYLLLWFLSKRKPPERIHILSIILVHIFFSQLFTEISLLSVQDPDRANTEFIFQEIFFVNGVMIFFTDSQVLKDVLLLYLAAISLLRLTTFENELQYISWVLMFTFCMCLPLLLRCRKKEIKPPVKPSCNQNKPLKLDTCLEGVALINKDQEILYMNGLFKGLMDSTGEREALEKMLKLKKVDTLAPQKSFLQEIKLKSSNNTATVYSRNNQKSFGDLPKSTSEHPTSLEVPKSGSYAQRRNASPRPSIFQHRTSILQHRNSVFVPSPSSPKALRKESRAQSTRSPDPPSSGSTSNRPLIKINLTKVQDVDSRPVWFGNDSESRSPLMKLGGEIGSGVDSFRSGPQHKLSQSQFSMVDQIYPEQVALRVDTSERNSPCSDNVESSIDSIFNMMSRNSDKMQNIVITQLIENLQSPLEIIKGHPSSPVNGRGAQESTTLGNTGRDKFHVLYKDAKKATKILEVTLCPFIYQQKECLCICMRDVSYELKSEDLSENLEYRNQLLRFVSHEFRGPLNCSISLLDALKKLVPIETTSKYVMPSLNSCKMLLNLANDILDHAQIQAKKLKINVVPCKIKKIFEEVIEMIEIQASGQDIELKLKWDSHIAKRFYTDPNRLRQILLNLVSNGLKYTSEGSITIQAMYVTPTICRISVTDTGVGISSENLKQLFQEFGKIQTNSHLNPNGVGLGLVISKMLTLELGPDNEGLMVESEEGKGTAFYFFLESKIEIFREGFEEGEEIESLEENGSSLFTVIKTTYGNLGRVKSRKTSIRLQPPQPLNTNSLKQKPRTLSPIPMSLKQDLGTTSKTCLNIPQSKTVENLESMFSVKKKSSDNIMTIQKKNPSPFPWTISGKKKETAKATIMRSYTMEGGGESTRRSNTIRSDSEFTFFLKKNLHTCNSPKALLVDDSRFNLTALETLLSNTFGIESKQVMNGQEAIEEVMKNEGCCMKCKNFKMIFMDIEMPRLNGFETTQILRKKMLDGEVTFIPIIGITGHNPNENRIQCLLSGMNDLVSKPISPKVIKQLMVKWMMP